jgi:predicted DNA-binding protein
MNVLVAVTLLIPDQKKTKLRGNDEGGSNMQEKPVEMVRVNTRISKKLNDWLDKQSAETGVPKSTLIHLALENYVQQKEAMDTMGLLLHKLDELEKRL